MSKKRRATRQKDKGKAKKIKRAHASDFVDREISLLEFNKRVLEQAKDPTVPLLERVRFLTIFHSNLDEFFMKRVERCRRVLVHTVTHEDGEEKVLSYNQYEIVRTAVVNLLDDAAAYFEQMLLPELKSHGVHLIKWNELSKKDEAFLKDLFETKIFPVLTPLAVDQRHPFPHISNLSTSLAVSLRYPNQDELFFARVKIPTAMDPWILLSPEDNQELRWVSLQDIISHNLHRLFPNMEVVSTMPFRVTRNIELEPDEDDSDDILEMVEQALRDRRFGSVVKLEVPPDSDSYLLRYLMDELGLDSNDVYEMKTELDFSSFSTLASLRIPEYRFPKWTPRVPESLRDDPSAIFRQISESDILVHHPYESFSETVERFIKAAVDDANVLAIKMTLYRTDEDSRLIRSLIRAAENGKAVVCIIELKARMDEARNIHWANELEDAGAHIVYGMVGLKTHAKATLVVRQEGGLIKSYAHLGTGNYNSATANLYTDFGLLTANPKLTTEVIELFHHLTGRSQKREYKQLLVAPTNMKREFLSKIDREIEHHKAGKPSHIIAKCNGLEDKEIVQALYAASQAGVKIDLIIRGMCTLRPGVPNLSENIRVVSVVDRFLEHSRVYFFQNGQRNRAKGEFYLGSADWMNRNLERRVEVCFPALDTPSKNKVLHALDTLLNDRVQAWDMQPDGSYIRLTPKNSSQATSAQEELMQHTAKLSRAEEI